MNIRMAHVGRAFRTMAGEHKMSVSDHTSVRMYVWILLSFAANTGVAL